MKRCSRSDSLPQSRLCRNGQSHAWFPIQLELSVTAIWEYAGSSISLLTRAAVHAAYLYSSAAITAYQRTSTLFLVVLLIFVRPCFSHESSSQLAQQQHLSTEINRRSKIKSGCSEFILVSPRYQCSRGLFSPQTKLPSGLFIAGERARVGCTSQVPLVLRFKMRYRKEGRWESQPSSSSTHTISHPG